jgi:hypothetical protein
MAWFRKKPSWETAYAERIYESLAAPDDLGDITPEKLRVPTAAYQQYRDKALLQREAMCFTALILVSGDKEHKGPSLLPVLREFSCILEAKLAARGLQVDIDMLADMAAVDVSEMVADPFAWAQRWLAEFRNDPNDNYMVALFANHCLKQYGAFKGAIETTRPK